MPRPLDRREAIQEFGTTGLRRFGGVVNEELLPELRGPRGVRVLRRMAELDPVIGAMLFGLEQTIRSVSWRVEAASEQREDQAAAAFVDECRDDMSHTWEDFIGDVTSMFTYGWAYFEEVYKIRGGPDEADPTRRSRYTDGRIGWRKFLLLSQESLVEWVFDEAGGIHGMRQSAPPDYRLRTIPIEKALLFRTKVTKGNPEGQSILRNAYRPWYFATRIEEIEGIGIERDLAGLPVLYVPANISDAEFERAKHLVRNIRRDEQEGVVIKGKRTDDGTGYLLQLLSTGGRRQFDTTDVINRYDRRKAMSVLMQFIFLGMERVGTEALSRDQKSLWLVAVQGWLRAIAAVLNRFAIPRLLQLNGLGHLKAYPRLVPADVTTPSLPELADYVNKLADKQVLTPDEHLEEYLRQRASLPQAPKASPAAKAASRDGERDLDQVGVVDLLSQDIRR